MTRDENERDEEEMPDKARKREAMEGDFERGPKLLVERLSGGLPGCVVWLRLLHRLSVLLTRYTTPYILLARACAVPRAL
jgi:hypothetical protein